MALVKAGAADDPLVLRIQDREIRIISGRDPSLPREPGHPRRRVRQPADEIDQRRPALPGLGPCDGESQLEPGDPAPGPREVTRRFEFRWTGRVVGGHEVQGSGEESSPERFLVMRLPDGWGALEPRVALAGVLGGEGQVVGTGFGREPDRRRFRARDLLRSFRRRHVNDVRSGSRLRRQCGNPRDRDRLGGGRPRRHPCGAGARTREQRRLPPARAPPHPPRARGPERRWPRRSPSRARAPRRRRAGTPRCRTARERP